MSEDSSTLEPSLTHGDDYVGQQRAVDTRRAILRHAARLFAAYGYDGCSIRDIAAAAGVTHTNVRYHFGDKENLWLKVVRFLISDSYDGRGLVDTISGSETPIECFRKHTLATIYYFIDKPELHRIVAHESLRGGERFKKIEGWITEAQNERVTHIRAMQDAGVVKQDLDPVMLNRLIGGALINMFIVARAQLGDDPAETDRFANALLELIERLVTEA